MKKKKIHWFDEHPELKSAVITFTTAFVPILIAQLNMVGDPVGAIETGAIWGVLATGLRMAFKAGINALLTWWMNIHK